MISLLLSILWYFFLGVMAINIAGLIFVVVGLILMETRLEVIREIYQPGDFYGENLIYRKGEIIKPRKIRLIDYYKAAKTLFFRKVPCG